MNQDRKKKTFLTSSWWVIAFMALSSLYHMHNMHKKNQLCAYLEGRVKELEEQKAFALQKKEELLMEIRSEEDPAWVEMVLMKGLGVVPEGMRKVYFTDE